MIRRLLAILILILALSMTASAYTIPVEYRGQVRTDIDLYILIQSHQGEAWVEPILADMEMHYVGYGRERLHIKMQSMIMPHLPDMVRR